MEEYFRDNVIDNTTFINNRDSFEAVLDEVAVVRLAVCSAGFSRQHESSVTHKIKVPKLKVFIGIHNGEQLKNFLFTESSSRAARV